MPEAYAPRALGRSGLTVSPLGVGTNKWSQGANDAAVLETWRTLLAGGVSFVDTAEVYGFGKSERLIGDCLRHDPRPVTVASKFAPAPARASGRHLLAALDASLARLGRKSLDLYYVHFPLPFADLGALADAMVEAVRAGKVRAVGVSNFSGDQMRRFADRLGRGGVPLAANEVNYSLVNRRAESNGVLDACRELDVALVAYFPLGAGRLTARPDAASPLAPLLDVLAGVAQARQATVSQVALNWLLRRDGHVIPIPGASKPGHAQQNIGALAWSLTDREFADIDAASAPWRDRPADVRGPLGPRIKRRLRRLLQPR